MRTVALALGADLAAVLLFAAVGRGSHAEGLDVVGVAATAAPFLAGLGVGWVAGRVWRAPTRLSGGCYALGGAVVIGLTLRWLLTGRLPASFVLVTALSLVVLLLGWRLMALAVLRTRRASI